MVKLTTRLATAALTAIYRHVIFLVSTAFAVFIALMLRHSHAMNYIYANISLLRESLFLV